MTILFGKSEEQHGPGRVSHPLLGLTRSEQLLDIKCGTCLKTFGIYLRIMENLEITVMKPGPDNKGHRLGYKESYDFTHWRSLIVSFGTKSDGKWSSNDNVEKIFPALAEENNPRGENSFKKK